MTIRKGLALMGTKQVELARLLGITPQAVAGIFAASDVRTGTVERICEVLNLPVTFFYNDVPDNIVSHNETIKDEDNDILDGAAAAGIEGSMEKEREIQYLRGQVAAYETALTILRPSTEKNFAKQ